MTLITSISLLALSKSAESPLHECSMKSNLAFFDPQAEEASLGGDVVGRHGFSVKVWIASQHK